MYVVAIFYTHGWPCVLHQSLDTSRLTETLFCTAIVFTTSVMIGVLIGVHNKRTYCNSRDRLLQSPVSCLPYNSPCHVDGIGTVVGLSNMGLVVM